MAADRKGEMKRKGNIFCRIISIVYTLLAVAFITADAARICIEHFGIFAFRYEIFGI